MITNLMNFIDIIINLMIKLQNNWEFKDLNWHNYKFKFNSVFFHLIVATSRLPRQVPVPIEGVELENFSGKRGRTRSRFRMKPTWTGSCVQELLRDLRLLLDRLLLVVAPQLSPEGRVAQLAFGLVGRHWAAGSFGQTCPEVWLVLMFGPAEHFFGGKSLLFAS